MNNYCIFFSTTSGSIGHIQRSSTNYPPTYQDVEDWQDEISEEFDVHAIVTNVLKLKDE